MCVGIKIGMTSIWFMFLRSYAHAYDGLAKDPTNCLYIYSI